MKPAPRDHFFARRWRGEIRTSTLLWWDMLLVGTAINIAATFTALILTALGFPPAVAVAVHFVPLPYNLFLFLSVTRSPQRSPTAIVAAFLWLAVVTVI